MLILLFNNKIKISLDNPSSSLSIYAFLYDYGRFRTNWF